MTQQTDRLNTALAGRYRIERELGAGGMATVYLAHDERHDRNVALKVLRPELAAVIGAERFLHEIKTTANLQHPHILPLHDSGTVEGTVWYVMPLVEGESLRDRLKHETQLPIDDALEIAREVASALDYAHRHGVVHRDIKPENILLHDGRAVVADFGIALAMSRTEGSTRLTETGMSLGTPHYMSPEQALGEKTVDARTDVYALGAVLYEMLVGEPPFTGPSAQAIIAKVMNAPPAPISALRPTVPAAIETAVMRALAKLPADRFKSAADFASALLAGAGGAVATGATTSSGARLAAAPANTGVMRFVPWLVAAGAVVIAARFAMRGTATDARVTAAVIPLEIRTPTNVPLNEVGPPVSISPDGRFIVFVGSDPEVPSATALWTRPLDRLIATPIAGTRGAQRPIVAADGKSVSFLARAAGGNSNQVDEVGFDGGLPQVVGTSRGMRRLADGSSVVAVDTTYVLLRPGDAVPAPITPVIAGATGRAAFAVSPDRRWIAAHRRTGTRDSVLIRTFDGRTKFTLAEGVSPFFLGDDLLVFRAPDGSLQVGQLDADRARFTSSPVSIVPNVSLAGDGNAVYSIGGDGTLVYAQGSSVAQSRIVWVAGGREQQVAGTESRVYGGVALSPNGRRAAVTIGALAGSGDIWIADLALGTVTPLTSDGISSRPTWSSDGKTITYLHATFGLAFGFGTGSTAGAWQRPVDRARVPDSVRGPWPAGGVDELVRSPDERYMALRVRHGARLENRDIAIRRVDSDSIVSFASEEAQERGPRFSPDGKWLLYASDRSGRDEIYAESFPGGGDRVQLSADGGREGNWSRDGSQAFYRALDGWMMSAKVARGAALQVTTRDRLFDANAYLANQYLAMYDVAADGRFLMIKLDPQPARTDVVVIRNWVQQVKARLKRGAQ